MSYSRESLIFMLNDRSVACSYRALGCTWEVATHERSVRESQEAIAECASNRLKETKVWNSYRLHSLLKLPADQKCFLIESRRKVRITCSEQGLFVWKPVNPNQR